jgi:epoxyqueuosine reductase
VAEILEAVRSAASPFGLNLIAAIPIARYDAQAALAMRAGAIDRAARAIIVVANGGGAFWQAYRAYRADHPGWEQGANPLDDFTRITVETRIMPVLDAAAVSATAVYPFVAEGPTVNFMQLGKLVGIAGPSLLGVVVNPEFGPWIAFRAAILIDREIDAPGEALDFDPCPSCTARSCIPACPAGAVSAAAGWNIPACLTYRVEREAECAPRCHARAACVLGPQYRYPDDELEYHQGRALRAMRPYYEAHIRPARAAPKSDG